MSSDPDFGGDSTHPLSDVPRDCFDLLRNPRRLRLLSILGAASRPLSVSDLTEKLARREGDDRQSVRISLVHTHLPLLSDHDVIEYDGDEVTLVDDAPVPSDEFVALLEADSTAERLVETLVRPERMAILGVLEGQAVCTIETLASELAAHDGTTVSTVEEATIALHHSHLPAMADLGVLEYDDSGAVVTTDRTAPLLW